MEDWEELRDETLAEGDSPPTPDSPGVRDELARDWSSSRTGRGRRGVDSETALRTDFFTVAVDGLPVDFNASLGAMEEEGEIEEMPSADGGLLYQ